MNQVVIAWDLDETLGSWVQLGSIWDMLKKITPNKVTQYHFNILMKLFPEYLRPNILKTLNTLKMKKKKDNNIRVVLFTNNQAPQSWARQIINFFNERLDYKLFTDIIPAYMVDGVHIAKCRTSHDKKYDDMMKCLKLTHGTQVCFIDDQWHEDMNNKYVEYIHLYPYEYILPNKEIIKRLSKSKLARQLRIADPLSLKKIERLLNEFIFTPVIPNHSEIVSEISITKEITKIILKFIKKTPSTRKRRKYRKNKTRKK